MKPMTLEESKLFYEMNPNIDYADVFVNAVYEYIASGIRDYIVSLIGNLSGRVNAAYVAKLFKEISYIGHINKYFLGEDKKPVPERFKFYVENALKYILEHLSEEGQFEVYVDDEEAVELIKAHNIAIEDAQLAHDDESDDEQFKQLAEEEEDYIDDDIEEFHEEKEIVDFTAMNRLALRNSDKLVIKSKEVKTAENIFKGESRVLIYNRTCYIRLDGITNENLLRLKTYLNDNKVNNGYKVILEMAGTFLETQFKVLAIDRDYINSLVYNVA